MVDVCLRYLVPSASAVTRVAEVAGQSVYIQQQKSNFCFRLRRQVEDILLRCGPKPTLPKKGGGDNGSTEGYQEEGGKGG